MTFGGMLLAEIRHRWLNFTLCLVAIATATGLFIAAPTIVRGFAAETEERLDSLQQQTEKELAALDKKTKRIMRDIGVNLRIVHKDTNFGSLYTDFVAHDFPEDYVQKLATAPSIETVVHVIAMLQHKTKWNDRSVLIVGINPVLTASQKNTEKPHMVKPVKPGTVLVGHELGAGMEVGGQVEIEGKSFTIASIEPEFGDLKDVQFVMHLDDAQTILDRGGKINQILALNCKCKGNRLSKVRAEVEEVLPDTKVAEHFTRAEAREKQRDLVEQARSEQLSRLKSNRDAAQRSLAVLLGVLSPIVVFGSALFVGVLTWLNVRERCHEIGVLRALGKGDLNIVALILARCALTGLIGGAIGVATYFAGSATAPSWLNEEALSSVQFIAPTTSLLILAIAGAPLVAIISGYLPTLVAIRQDTARVLAAN